MLQIVGQSNGKFTFDLALQSRNQILSVFAAFESLQQKTTPQPCSFPRGVHRIRVLLRRGIAFDLFGDSPVAPRLGGEIPCHSLVFFL